MQIPISFCDICDESLPVVVKEISLEEFSEDEDAPSMQVVYCPACGNILNLNEDHKVEWYDLEELHKVTNYKYIEGESNE